MDPITPGVISGLVTNALGGAAGSIPRVLKSRRKREVDAAIGDLQASAQSFLLPALAELADRRDGAQETVGLFLGTVEAETYVRSVACAALSGQLKEVRSELQDQLVALLVLVANTRRDAARKLAELLLGLFTKTIETASARLAQADRELHLSVVDRARTEKQAGSLDGLVQRNRLLQRHDPTKLTDFLDFADQYRTLLHDRTSELVPAYVDVQRRVPIDRLYVEPRFSYKQKTESLDTLLTHAFHTVILGDPGAGKSTLAQYLAHVHSAPRMVATDDFGVLPFVVTLRTYDEWKRTEHGSVIAFIATHIVENFQLPVPEGAIEYLLLTGRAFVLFDGLDELVNISMRREICEVITNFADLYASATILVTSRKIGYFEAPLTPTRFSTASLLNFTDDDVETYVTNWFTADNRLDHRTRPAMVRSFLEESKSVRDIRANALMLGLMCNLYRRVRAIPQNRMDLYEKCALMLFEQWDTGRGITSHVLRADAKSALQDVALWMYTTPELSDGVSEKQLVHRLTEFWSKRVEDRQRAVDMAKELVSLWKGRTWVLTDVGITGSEPRLIYKFTHQTFLEFFAAVEVVRRHPSPEALWQRLRERVAEGAWEIVAQLAIQKLDEFCLDGADAVLDLLVTEATDTDIGTGTNLLLFASRNLDSLYARPSTHRRLVTAAMDLALTTLPSTGTNRNSKDYLELVMDSVRLTSSDNLRTGEPRALWQPVLQLLENVDEQRELVIDQLLRHGCDLITHGSPEASSSAFVFLMLRDSFEHVARVPSHKQLTVDVPAELWNIQEIERRLGQPLSTDRILRWSRTNFWAAVLACRERLIAVTDLVESVGVTMLACTADPFLGFGGSLSDKSPIKELLIAYLGCSYPFDQCWFSEDDACRTLAVIGRALDRELPRFDGEWLSDSSLYERIVRRRFVFDDFDELAPASSWPETFADQDAAFGAAVLLAGVIETERWNMMNYRSLLLGPLQVLEPVFAARTNTGFWDVSIEDVLASSGLPEPRTKILADWAHGRITFTR